ncbi:MAG: DUF3365 domain-containing protein [Acidobacteriota bacterium]
MKKICAVLSVLLIGSLAFLILILGARPRMTPATTAEEEAHVKKHGSQELAYLLVKLELRTRAVIGQHYTRPQSGVPGINLVYQRWLAKNEILPAAVADRIFSEVVPVATGGRAWVKMVVDEPRNPNNRADSIGLELLREIKSGDPEAERSTPEAYYYGEPIKATKTCLPCHGEPQGDPDPMFPQYQKNGWQEGDIVGAVIARVAPVE